MRKNQIKKYPAWEELTFANNFMFCKIMETEPEICRHLLEMLLHVKIERLEMPHSEHTMQEIPDAKSVRFDVYTQDGKRIFDLEIQTTDNPNLPKRARYYQSIIDMDNLSRGENYSRLKDTYVIFLCLEDPLKQNLPVYFFENIFRDDDGNEIKLNDGAYKVFFNASEYAKIKDGEEKSFFRFLVNQSAESDFTRFIEEKVSIARKNMTWRHQYMTWQQTIDEEKDIAFEEGMKLGIEQGKIQSAVLTVQKYNVKPEDAAKDFNVPLDVLLSKLELYNETDMC